MRKIVVMLCASALALAACGGTTTGGVASPSVPVGTGGPGTGPGGPGNSSASHAPASPSDPPPGHTAQYVVWQGEQLPSARGVEQQDRIQQVPPVGPLEGRPMGQVTRFELHSGDQQTGGGYTANRVEVYSRRAESDSVPAQEWPDPPGAVRWFGFSVYFPEDFPTTTDGEKWLTFTQWKGAQGGSPPLALEVKRDTLRLGGARANAGLLPADGVIGPLARGVWTRLEIGISMSPDPAAGWVEVWRDGQLALPRTTLATMDLIDDQPDPLYFKQGIYRDNRWTPVHVLYVGPTKIGTSRDKVT